jgi:hypothetical protein
MAAQGETRSLESPAAGPGPTARTTSLFQRLTELGTGPPRASASAHCVAPTPFDALPLHGPGYRVEVRCTYQMEGPAAGAERRACAAPEAGPREARGG